MQPNWQLIEEMSEMEDPIETLPGGVTVKVAVVELAKALMQAVNSGDDTEEEEEEDTEEDEGAEDTESEDQEEMFEDEEHKKEDE